MDAKTETVTPAAQLARANTMRIPNESPEYRTARTALLTQEIELRRQIETWPPSAAPCRRAGR